MLAVYRKEMRSYFINPIGYIYLGIFLVFSALLCCYTTIISGTYNTSSYFYMMIFAFIILIPILTMRLFAEERKMRTEQMLLTAPISLTGMVLGKYFAALTLFLGGVLLSCLNFLPLYVIASVERQGTSETLTHVGPVTGEIVGGVIALCLLGAALIAVGMLISALTEN
ncbi:MAG: ABC-2 transporter permease, partial [Clostridia bacterium]|nr:ABC-2 transporter permease [Clostridia bacterium]